MLYFVSGHHERGLASGDDQNYGRAAQVLRNEGYQLLRRCRC